MSKRGLGRGLGALLGEAGTADVTSHTTTASLRSPAGADGAASAAISSSAAPPTGTGPGGFPTRASDGTAQAPGRAALPQIPVASIRPTPASCSARVLTQIPWPSTVKCGSDRCAANASMAPWAEIVPGMGPVTVDDLLTIPDDGYVYEVVAGVLVRMAGSGEWSTTVAVELTTELRIYNRAHRLGVVTGPDGVYRFPGAETGLLPDVGYYAAEKRALIVDRSKPIPFAPDLAVEVASPSQTADQMAAKARTYLNGGTLLVWVLWPQGEHIDVWHPGQLAAPVATLHSGDQLDGENVLPGFSYPVADVFADPLA